MWEDEQGWADFGSSEPEWTAPSFDFDFGDSNWEAPTDTWSGGGWETPPPSPDFGGGGGASGPAWSAQRAGERAGATTEDWINSGMRYGGTASRGNAWLEQIRHRPGMMHEPNLRNASHAMFVQDLLDRPGMDYMHVPGGSPAWLPTAAGMVRPMVPALAPLYSGAKWLAQNVPGGQMLDSISPVPLHNASAPSWEEVYWGLRPLWSRLGINERR